MMFQLEVARPEHAPRITQIHIDAFGTNAIVRAIHAADRGFQELCKAIERKALADMADSNTTVLIARNAGGNADDLSNIIGFAKWVAPIHPEEQHFTPPWDLEKTADWEILGPWIEIAQKVEDEIIGNTPHWGMHSIHMRCTLSTCAAHYCC
jgi:hypothetical protein